MSKQLYTHRKTGAVHKLLEVCADDGTFSKPTKIAVTVQTNFVSEPTKTTDSWLGDWQSFQREFEQVK